MTGGSGALAQPQDDDGGELRIIDMALAALTPRTTTPDDAYFLLWDGMPWTDAVHLTWRNHRSPAVPATTTSCAVPSTL
ncbi:MAG: hypothetical protein E7A56_03035 [Cutibacterium avidum]|nr:hypothetical protein [Cutibacterium avidum]